jgi:hypothetical protein
VSNAIGLNDGYVIDPERKHKSSTGNGPLRTINLQINNILKVKQTLQSLAVVDTSPEITNLINKLGPVFDAATTLGKTQLLGIEGFRPMGTSESIKETLNATPRATILNKLEEVAQVIEQINVALISIKDSDPLSAQNSAEVGAKLTQINTAIDSLNGSGSKSDQIEAQAISAPGTRKPWGEPLSKESILMQMEDEPETEADKENIEFTKPVPRKQWAEPLSADSIQIQMEDEPETEADKENIEFKTPTPRKQWGEPIAREDIKFETQKPTKIPGKPDKISFTNPKTPKTPS